MKMKRKLLLLLAGLAVLGCGTALAAEADGHPDNFYKSDKVTVQNVDFNNQYKMKVAGHLFTPKVKNANNGAAVIVGHPMGAVKNRAPIYMPPNLQNRALPLFLLTFPSGAAAKASRVMPYRLIFMPKISVLRLITLAQADLLTAKE